MTNVVNMFRDVDDNASMLKVTEDLLVILQTSVRNLQALERIEGNPKLRWRLRLLAETLLDAHDTHAMKLRDAIEKEMGL